MKEQIIEILKKEFEKFRHEPFRTSLDSYLETGKLSGSFYQSIEKLADHLTAEQELTVREVSNEEISEKSVDAYECNTMDEAFEMGAKWMRDKMNSLKS